MNVVQLAEDLAAAGVPVFPCGPEKRPACPHGFKDATTDPARVRLLWRYYPGPLIGVPTGAASGFDVLDVDPRHGGDCWWRANAHRLPPTRIHHTRSGGLHVLFRHLEPVRNSESRIGPGVDTRGEGGYIVWWPAHGCALSDAPIAAWPRWLLGQLLSERRRRVRGYTGSLTPLDSTDAAQAMAARAIERVVNAPEGQRHYKLRAAACTMGGLLEHLPIGENEATHRLVEAARRAGAKDLIGAERTAIWGIAKGKSKPFAVAPETR